MKKDTVLGAKMKTGYPERSQEVAYLCHVHALKLEHTEKLCLPDSFGFSDTEYISANVEIGENTRTFYVNIIVKHFYLKIPPNMWSMGG